MLDQWYDPELYYGWLTSNDQVTRFRKARDNILERVKVPKTIYVQLTQYYEEDPVLKNMGSIRTDSLSFIDPGTGVNHAPVVQVRNSCSSTNRQ